MSEFDVIEICKYISKNTDIRLEFLVDVSTKELTKIGAICVVSFVFGFTHYFLKTLSQMKGSE